MVISAMSKLSVSEIICRFFSNCLSEMSASVCFTPMRLLMK